MSRKHQKIRMAVRREHAEDYILISLVSFAVTVIVTRVFLQLTGFPQLGNSVLHIAHALWGGLLLIIAAYLPLAYANRWAIQVSALVGGIGIGLFIDEIGKFITQANDYFFPPALPIIYGFFLLILLVYLHFRRPNKADPRNVMYHILDQVQDALDGDLDKAEAARIERQLAIAKQSDREEIVTLANALSAYLQEEKGYLAAAEPDFLKRVEMGIKAFGEFVGRQRHRLIVSLIMIGWTIFVISYIVLMVLGAQNLDSQIQNWRIPLISIQIGVGILMAAAVYFWLTDNERRGLEYGISGFLLSLIALQTLYFYISQFSAVTNALLQLVFLFVLISYNRWYLRD